MSFEPARCPNCHAGLVPAPEALDHLGKGAEGPLGALKMVLRDKRTLGTILVGISCVAAVPALLGSFVALACAFSGGEFGGKGAAGPAVFALIITAGLCLMGFLPLYFGILLFKSARRLREAAAPWLACPSCGWAEEPIPEALLEAMPSLGRQTR